MARDLLDLHGCRVEEIWARVDRFLQDAAASGLTQDKIMTGKGTGKVREETLKALKLGGFIYKPEKLKDGRLNDGVWIVYF